MNKALEVIGSGVVSISDHIESSETFKQIEGLRTFEYSLRDKTAKAKLVKAAKRDEAFKVEENSSSSNLVFSAGAWHTVVLPSLRYWNEVKDDKACIIGDYTIKIGGITGGVDANGKHVDSKVVFLAGRDKVTCHMYNTTCLILVNGHGFRKLIELFLVPFFKAKISTSLDESEAVNEMVLEKLGSKFVKRADIKYKKGVSFPCTKCEYAAKSLSTLSKHKRVEHTTSFTMPKTRAKSIKMTMQSTRNNSITELMMNEDITITELENDSVSLEEKSFVNDNREVNEVMDDTLKLLINSVYTSILEYCVEEEELKYMKLSNKSTERVLTCGFGDYETISPVDLNEHEGKVHGVVNCNLCDYSALDEEILRKHMTKHTGRIVFQCGKCEFEATKEALLDDHKESKHTTQPEPTVEKRKCEKCEKEFDAGFVFEAHKCIVTSKFQCELCTFKAVTLSELLEHMVTNHAQELKNHLANVKQPEPEHKKDITCENCGDNFLD